MGYTMRQIDLEFNNVIGIYKSLGYNVVPCSSLFYLGSVYRQVDLSKDIYGSKATYRITLSYNREHKGVSCIDLNTTKYVDGKVVGIVNSTSFRFYRISDNYYTLSECEAKKSAEVSTSRYINHIPNSVCCYLNVDKLSKRSSMFIRSKIDTYLSKHNRTNNYSIYDVYFSYKENSRHLTVVFKNNDLGRTEYLTLF